MLLKDAAGELPRAMVVFCDMQCYLKHDMGKAYAKFMQKIPEVWLNRVITARQLGEFMPYGDKNSKLDDYFRKTIIATEKNVRQKVFKAWSLFQDRLSQATYLAVLKRYLLKSDTFIPLSDGRMYFEKFFSLNPNEVVIDCGAYTGDTLKEYLEHVCSDVAEYNLIEPDPRTCKILTKNVKKLPVDQKKLRIWPNAVGHTLGTLSFESIGDYESKVSPDNGNIKVPVITLDTAFKGSTPTFIKMDVEGYEAFTLLGGRELIKRTRPILAVCVYHYSFDLWDLPLMVANFAKGYRFVLRAYAEMFDYICYCIPEERYISGSADII